PRLRDCARRARSFSEGRTPPSSGGVTESALAGITRNPWNLEHTPTGSSGGAGVAAALGLGPLHVATDGGGSIRIPASACGVFGLKPSYGRVPGHPPAYNGTMFH